MPPLETALLLYQHLTFGFASLALRARRAADGCWPGWRVTFLLGLGFVILEIREFTGMIAVGAGPDRSGSCRPSSPWSAPTACM